NPLAVHAPGPSDTVVHQLIPTDEAAAVLCSIEALELFAGMHPALAIAHGHQPSDHPWRLVRRPGDGIQERHGFTARAALAARGFRQITVVQLAKLDLKRRPLFKRKLAGHVPRVAQ